MILKVLLRNLIGGAGQERRNPKLTPKRSSEGVSSIELNLRGEMIPRLKSRPHSQSNWRGRGKKEEIKVDTKKIPRLIEVSSEEPNLHGNDSSS